MGERNETAGEKPFECDMCGDRFATEEQLKDHRWEYHEMGGDVPP